MRGRRLVLTSQVFRPPVQEHHALHRMRGQDLRVGLTQADGIRARGTADGRGSGKLPPLPGAAGKLQQDGKRQGTVAAQKQVPSPGGEDLINQGARSRLQRAQRVLKRQAGIAAVPAAPVIGMPGVSMRATRCGCRSGSGG